MRGVDVVFGSIIDRDTILPFLKLAVQLTDGVK
jgi:hypothetical protein